MKVETFFTLSFSVSHTFFILLAPAVRESGDRFLTSRETFEKTAATESQSAVNILLVLFLILYTFSLLFGSDVLNMFGCFPRI